MHLIKQRQEQQDTELGRLRLAFETHHKDMTELTQTLRVFLAEQKQREKETDEVITKVHRLEKRVAANDSFARDIRRYWKVILAGLSLLHPLVYQKITAALGADPLVPQPQVESIQPRIPVPGEHATLP